MKRDTGPGSYSATEDLRSKSTEGLESLARGEFGTITLEEIRAEARRQKGLESSRGVTTDAKNQTDIL